MAYGIIVVLAVLCIISFFYVPLWVFGIFMVVWLLWSVFVLAVLRKAEPEVESVFARMRQHDRNHIFGRYIADFADQDKWLLERTAALQEFSPEYLDLAVNLQSAMDANFEKADTYMKACDYHDDASRQKYKNKIDMLYHNNCEIIDRINTLIGQLAELENSAEQVDMERVDDIIASLKELTGEGV